MNIKRQQFYIVWLYMYSIYIILYETKIYIKNIYIYRYIVFLLWYIYIYIYIFEPNKTKYQDNLYRWFNCK